MPLRRRPSQRPLSAPATSTTSRQIALSQTECQLRLPSNDTHPVNAQPPTTRPINTHPHLINVTPTGRWRIQSIHFSPNRSKPLNTLPTSLVTHELVSRNNRRINKVCMFVVLWRLTHRHRSGFRPSALKPRLIRTNGLISEVPTTTKTNGRPGLARTHFTQSRLSTRDGPGTGSGCVCQVPR